MRKPYLKGALIGGLSAAVVFTASAALAGSGIGGVFNLGVKNSVNATSTLVGKTAGAMLAVKNTGAGPAASFTVGKGKPPFAVSSTGKVAHLNADLLDGKDSSAFAPAGQSDLQAYCALVKAHPRSYHPGPCQGFAGPVDTAGEVGEFTSIAIGTDGLSVVSYRDSTNADLKVAHCGNAFCSSGNTLTPVDTVGNVGVHSSIAIGADGLPVVSYLDVTNGDLKVAHCGNLACSSGNTLTPVDTAGNVGEFTSIAIGAEGLPVVSYYDRTNQDLKVAHCGNVSCSSGNTLMSVDTAGNVGTQTSITVGADGLPVVSYEDVTNGDLKVAHCGNPACSTGNRLTPVDTPGDVGAFTSIAIGTDGLPVVSYEDVTNLDLKVAHCGNRACSFGNRLTSVDTPGDVGLSTSIAIGTDGVPVVSYWDFGNGDLKVARPPVT